MKGIISIAITILLFQFTVGTVTAQEIDGQKLFKSRCASCHNIGKGKLVGPDLKDITDKREADWLHQFIRNSQEMVKAGDAEAVAIFNEFNKIPMPPHMDIDDNQMTALLAYIDEQSAGGPAVAVNTGVSTTVTTTTTVTSAPIMGSIHTVDGQFFRLLFWMSTLTIVGVVFTLGYLIAAFAKHQ